MSLFSHFTGPVAGACCVALSSYCYGAAEQDWGIAAMSRTASIPFHTADNDKSVSTFIPMLFLENDHVYVRGTEGGVYLYGNNDAKWNISALARLRFVDIPKSVQNTYQGDTGDLGARLSYRLDDNWQADAELMSDSAFNIHSNYRLRAQFNLGDWRLQPYLTLRYKDADFNSTYFAFSSFSGEHIGAGIDINAGLDLRYHVTSNFYLLAGGGITRLDNNAYHSQLVEHRYQGEVTFGIGFFTDQSKAPQQTLTNRPYVRLAHGWATPSNLGEIFNFNREKDPYNNQLSSVFYGYPLTDNLFSLPLDIYFTPGLVHHWSSKVQNASTEYVAAIKAYYTFNWPVTWRFGVAEGLSYIDNITYIERSELEEKGYTPNRLLNYLDFSFDVNLGQLISNASYNRVWLGYSVHHRSAIFEYASQYGRIKGGSNYNTIYVQIDL